jgi:HSP20 family protein
MSTATMTPAPKTSTAPVKTPARGPYDLIHLLNNEMDRVFGEFGFAPRWPFALRTSYGEGTKFTPEIEVEETGGKLLVRADLPGLTKENVTVDVMNGILTITGERRHAEERKSEGYFRSERSYGNFSRSIALPEGAKPETAKAAFKNGVLEVAFDMPEPPKPAAHRIPIEEAASTPSA